VPLTSRPWGGAPPRAPPHRSRRRRQDQRAGTRRDQHGHRHGRRAAEQQGRQGAEQHYSEVGDGEALQQSGHRRLGLLGLLHQGNHPAHGGVAAQPHDLHDQTALEVERRGLDGIPDRDLDGQRFAGQGRLIKGRAAVGDHAIGGQPVARADFQAVAQAQLVDRRLVDGPAGTQAAGGPAAQPGQGGDRIPGAKQAAFFQDMADDHGERNQGRGLEIADRPRSDQRGRHQEVGDPVQAWAAQGLPRGGQDGDGDQGGRKSRDQPGDFRLMREHRADRERQPEQSGGRPGERQARSQAPLFAVGQQAAGQR
jgi:hypothetical protein